MSVVFSFLFLASNADASSFSLNNNLINVKKGDVVSVKIGVNSKDQTNYTFSISASFNENILSVVDWKYKEGWIPLSVGEYDVTDNLNGNFVKTAGYPRGTKNIKDFGIITFVAKKSGQAIVSVNMEDSFILNIDGNDTLNK